MPESDNQFLHIFFERETRFDSPRRKPRGWGSRPPAPASRANHGQVLLDSSTEVIEETNRVRRQYGINPDNLVVVEFSSLSDELRMMFEERLQAWIVEEKQAKVDGQDIYQVKVQFENVDALNQFQEELEFYQSENQDRALLTKRQRTNFFDALMSIHPPSKSDRMGPRLLNEGVPDSNSFHIDVDLWHPGNDGAAVDLIQQMQNLCRQLNGREVERVRTKSLLLLKVFGNTELLEALLNLDVVALVDLPPKPAIGYANVLQAVNIPDDIGIPSSDTPSVCVIDSGVVSGHPFLVNWVIDEVDFDSGENTPVDLNGHGTAIAGIVAYGDIARCIDQGSWEPKVKIYSAKILQNGPNNNPMVPERHRVESLTENAIRHFAGEGCRIFNLSVGNHEHVYADGRQFAWAEKLDELILELDIIVVVSAGNCLLDIPSGQTRSQVQDAIQEAILDPRQRICSPATSALALTVGALARNDTFGRAIDAFPGAKKNMPSPFTRTGPGYKINDSNLMVKPDCTHYGGNVGIQTLAGGDPKWLEDIGLDERTIIREQNGRLVGGKSGTSFATAHISHIAALVLQSLQSSLSSRPSSNLVRAIIGSGSSEPDVEETEWMQDWKKKSKLIGYGQVFESDIEWSKNNDVRLVAQDAVREDHLHIYRIPLPSNFNEISGTHGITVSLAYNPPVRSTRRQYLSRTMWVEAFQGLTTAEIQAYKASYTQSGTPPKMAKVNEIGLTPSKSKAQWSTLQVRRKIWQRTSSIKSPQGEEEPVVHILVGCQHRFPSGLGDLQDYGLVVHFWHSDQNIQLYQEIQNRVGVLSRIRV